MSESEEIYFMHVFASKTPPPNSVCACCDCFGPEGEAVCTRIQDVVSREKKQNKKNRES